MRPLTFSTNKHFIPLANKPLLYYAVEGMAAAGIKQIGVNYNPGQLEEIKSRLGTGRKWGVKFSFIFQEKPLGLAHIIKVSRQFLGKGKFVMHLGDNIFYGGIKDLVNRFSKSKASALLTLIHHPENKRLGVPYFSKRGKLLKVVEKPRKSPHDWAVPGLYFFDEQVFSAFSGRGAIRPSARGELEIGSLYNWLIKRNHSVESEEFKGVWRDPGKFDDWLGTNQFLLDSILNSASSYQLGKRVRIEGRVKIGMGCKIKNTLLRGPLIIGSRVIINDSFIGPYSSIADNCQIEKAKIENSVLMRGVRINSPGKPLDSCLIGEKTLIQANYRSQDTIELFLGNKCVLKF